MKDIPVSILKPGMIFTEPVYIDEDNFLVPPGIAVRQRDLSRLTRWGIEKVQTTGALAKTPETIAAAVAKQKHSKHIVNQVSSPAYSETAGPAREGESDKFDNGEIQENKPSYREYITLVRQLDAIFSHVVAGIALRVPVIEELSNRLFSAIQDEWGQFIGYILEAKASGYKQARNSVNSAILAAIIARELKLPSPKVMAIITGALLHDIGMFRLLEEIPARRGGLTQEDIKLLRTHPLRTYLIISKELNYPEEVGFVVLQHHERWDGQGYPAGVSGENIDIGARILSVADAFEAVIGKKPSRNFTAGCETMRALMADNQSRFDPNVLGAFVAVMGIYPVGSIVVLNDAAIARVTEILPGSPPRPKVQILIDKFGQQQQNGEILNLLTDKKHFVLRALNLKELVNRRA
ncbi:MAG: HD-GYP domain-containing protein [Treponema sp.]|nr:HD-GYP domain-containing protein [Treponema sp.]